MPIETAPAQDRPARADAWTMFRGDVRLSGVAGSTLPDRPEVLWKFETQEPFESSAAIADGMVFVGCDDEQFYALDLASGSLRWKFATQSTIRSSPAVVGSRVVFGDGEGLVHCLDAKDGTPLWSHKTEGEIISSPTPHAGRILVGSYDGNVYCLKAEDGRLEWKFATGERVHGTISLIENNQHGASTPNVGDLALVAGCDEYLHVIKIADGSEVRKIPMGSVSGAGAAVHGSRVFLGTYGNQVRCIDWSKGETLWTFEDSERQFPFMASAALAEKLILVGGRDKRFRAFDLETGKIAWTVTTKGRVDSSAVLVGDRAYFGSADGVLYAVDQSTGAERWRFEAGGPISASPAVAAGRLVIGTQDGILYCFGSKP